MSAAVTSVVFAGTPAFAAAALDAILDAGFDVPLVLTQPDRAAGRGMALQPSAVKQLALRHGLAVHQPVSLKTAEARAPIAAAAPDVMVVAAYGLLLPQAVLDMPRLGCLNIHASLLPRWRGAAPIQRAIAAGDTETGITLMQMEAGLDTGPMLARRALPITALDTAQSLHDKLAALGAAMIVPALRALPLPATPQPPEGITYAAKLTREEAQINWHLPARAIERRLRAFDPFPGCVTKIGELPIKLWRGVVVDESGAPGTVLRVGAEGVCVACGEGAILLTELQKAGGKRLAAGEFLRGLSIEAGARLG
jgi:methionyl-tRNA formyltransferase